MVQTLNAWGLSPEWLEYLQWTHRDVEMFMEMVKAKKVKNKIERE